MFPTTRSIRRTLSCAVFTIGIMVFGASTALAAMAEFPDILGGERQVLQVDDIVVAQTFKSPFDTWATRRVDLGLTSNSVISQEIGANFTSMKLSAYVGTAKPFLVAAGRVFDMKTDVAVTFTYTDHDYVGGPWLENTVFLKNPPGSASPTWERPAQKIPMTVLQPRAIAMGDFTGDGFAEVVFHAGSLTTQGSGRTIIGTSDGATAPSYLRFGPEHAGPVGWPACVDMKVADLNGDGRPEIICLVHSGDFLWLLVNTVDPATLAILDPPGNNVMVAMSPYTERARLAVGKFDGTLADAEVAVVHGGSSCTTLSPAACSVFVRPYKVRIDPTTGVSFFAMPAADIGPLLDITSGMAWNVLTGLEVATGKLNWFGGNSRDQLVVGAGLSSSSHYRGYAAVVVDFTTDETNNQMAMNATQIKASAYNNAAASTSCLAGVAVGRFSPPPPANQSTAPTNAQVALLLGGLSSGDSLANECVLDDWGPPGSTSTTTFTFVTVETYTVDPTNSYKLTRISATPFPHGGSLYNGGVTFTPPRMAVGDFQGRSLLLGQPTIITIAQQLQPQFVIGAPPMHLDYFTPLFGTERPACYADAAKYFGQEPTSQTSASEASGVAAMGCIQNVSAFPGHTAGATACDYCAKFSMADEQSSSGAQKSVTSHTWSNEGGGSEAITLGTLKPTAFGTGGLQLEAHGSAKVMHSTSDSTLTEVLSKQTLKLDTATGPDDYVWFTSQDVYLYMYPVIGQKDPEGKPIYLNFSVPDQTHFLHSDAASLPWYQPAHEVGNIFSYPGNVLQLQIGHPGALVRSGPLTWSSHVADNTTINWTQGSSEAKTAGSVDRTDWNVGTSMTGVIKIGVGGASVTSKTNVYYDHNESNANEYTNTNKKTLSKSVGFGLTTEVFNTSVAESAYRSGALILGTGTPVVADGYWDDEVPMPDPQGVAGDGFVPDFRLDGPMQLVYTTSMLTDLTFTAGTMWSAIYGAKPDIALQHHKRFFYKGRASTASLSDWWKFNPLYKNITLSTVYASEFLMMKGFFINPWSAASGQGPQMTMTEEGQQLRLAARVYNYSLASLPTGATVKVRFYAHQLLPDPNSPHVWASPGGCTLIGEASLPPIGPFTIDTTKNPNWAMAETRFDTTGYGGQNVIFWVVAWAEKSDGTLLPELDQHGLTAKPPAGPGCPANSILDIPIEYYSNNVGFYPQPFYVKAKALAAAPRLRAAATYEPFSIGALTVATINDAPRYAGEQWELIAPLHAGSQDATSVHLVQSGSGPGGHVSYTGLVPFIEAGQTYVDRVPFRPLWCGPHSAIVTARPGFQEQRTATLEFEIPCRPEDVTAFLNDVITDASLAGVVRVNKSGQVLARYAAIQNALLTAEQLARTGQVRGACVQYAQALARIPEVATGPVAQLLMDIIRNARGELRCR